MAALVNKKNSWQKIAFACSTMSILFFLWIFGAFVGIENNKLLVEFVGDHIKFHTVDDVKPYSHAGIILFLKRAPSSHIVYSSVVQIGEANLRTFEQLDKSELNRFQEFCNVKYYLPDTKKCYLIYLNAPRIDVGYNPSLKYVP